MNSFGPKVHVEMRFHLLCIVTPEGSHHIGSLPYLPNFRTSSKLSWKEGSMKFSYQSQLNSNWFRGTRKTVEKYSIYTSCLFLRLQEHISSCNSCFINIQGIHLLCCLQLAYAAAGIPIFQNAHFPFQLFMYSLCCITVTVLNCYSNVLRADSFLRISLLMFADLFYILVDKSSNKPFNFLKIQFKLFFSFCQNNSVF